MNPRFELAVIVVVVTSACTGVSVSRLPPVDRESALKVSDEFMSDLVGDRVQDALAKYEPGFVAAMEPAEAESSVRALFDYCGRPLDSELKHEEVGVVAFPDGRKKATHQFIYAATTTAHAKGECFFAVTLVSEPGGPRVTNFGPLKLVAGTLPEWAR